MPLKTGAASVRDRYTAQAQSRVEKLVAGEVGEVKKLFTRALKAFEKGVDAKFAELEAAGQPPYPQYEQNLRRWVAYVEVTFDAKDETNRKDVQQRLAEKAYALLTEQGFGGQVTCLHGVLRTWIFDATYQPIDVAKQADALFEQGVKA